MSGVPEVGRTVPIAVPILSGSGEVVGEPGQGRAAHGEVGVLVALGGQWLGVDEDGLDDGDVHAEVHKQGRGGALGGVEGDRWDAGVDEGGACYHAEGGQAT